MSARQVRKNACNGHEAGVYEGFESPTRRKKMFNKKQKNYEKFKRDFKRV